MEFFDGIAFSSSQLLVVFAFGLFATIIFASVYLRIKAQYSGRNKLPDHTKKRVFGVRRTREPILGDIPTEHSEVVSEARPKDHSKQDEEGFQFDFDVPVKPAPSHIDVDAPSFANGGDAGTDQDEHVSEAFIGASASTPTTGATQHEYEDRFGNGSAPLSEVPWEENGTSQDYGDDRNDFIDIDQNGTTAWEDPHARTSDADEEVQETIDLDSVATDDVSEYKTTYESRDIEEAAEHVYAYAQGTNDEYDSANGYQNDGELATATYDDQEVEQFTEPEVEESVVPFDHRTTEAKRADTTADHTDLNFAVVSVCLISEEDGQIYRDIRGEHLARFLSNRGFIFLDEEYHLQNKSMVEKGAIRVRNFEAAAIGDLVRGNEETRGFRLYFKPSDCVDPLATLNEMLKVSQSAIGFFSEVSSKPLKIYDGRKDSNGNISPLTQEDYDTLKRDLSAAFPRQLDDATKRIAVSGSDYAPSEDLPTRAEGI